MSNPTVALVGRLAADPRLSYSTAGKAVLSGLVITNDRRRGEDGTWTDSDPSGWAWVAFGPTAEAAAEQLTKGTAVVLVGRMREHRWESDAGERRSRPELVVDTAGLDLRWSKPATRTTAAEQPTPADTGWEF